MDRANCPRPVRRSGELQDGESGVRSAASHWLTAQRTLKEQVQVQGEARGHPGRSGFNDFQRVGSFPAFLANRRRRGLEGHAPLNAFERVD